MMSYILTTFNLPRILYLKRSLLVFRFVHYHVTNFIDVVISDIDKQLLATDKNTVPINIANQ